MHLSALFIYPVKSLRGCAVGSAEVDALGLVGDRRFMVVDADGRFLTQRALPRMALIETALSATTLTLSATGAGSCRVARNSVNSGAGRRSVSVWKSAGLQADDCGDEPAAWLSDFLGTTCRLVRIGEMFSRPIPRDRLPAALNASTFAGPTADGPSFAGPAAGGPSFAEATAGGQLANPNCVSFADAFPFLVISESSLAELNDRLVAHGEDALPMDRFRPNLVVTGCAAFAEDTWTRFRIGDIVFHAAGPCARCVVTTTDQQTAERGKEPLRTLATYRRDATDPTDVNFGQNLIHETKSGTVRVGDAVEVLPAVQRSR